MPALLHAMRVNELPEAIAQQCFARAIDVAAIRVVDESVGPVRENLQTALSGPRPRPDNAPRSAATPDRRRRDAAFGVGLDSRCCVASSV